MKSVKQMENQRSDLRVFRRWSRKSYAAFASMNQEIKISCINTSYNLLVPSKENGFSGFCYLPKSRRDENEAEEFEPLDNELLQLLLQNESTAKASQKESFSLKNKILSDSLFISYQLS
jgi:hypothetical protein